MTNYEDYLEYFFNNAKTAVENGKDQELSDNLLHIEELLQELISRNIDLEAPLDLPYSFCRRQYVRLYIEILENGADESLRYSVISSISSVVNYSRQAGDIQAFEKLFGSLSRCYVQSYPIPGFDGTTGDLLDLLGTIQFGVSQQFEDADDIEELNKASELARTLLVNYRTFWRYAVNYECIDSIKYLDQSLDTFGSFGRYQYSSKKRSNKRQNNEFLDKKQQIADTIRRRMKLQRFAAYSWAYNLYLHDEISSTFLKDLFSKYAKEDFDSVEELSEVYLSIDNVLDEYPYWEQWDTDRQLEEAAGPIMTRAGMSTWIPSFYIAFSLYIFDQENQDKLSNTTVENLPFSTDDSSSMKLDQLQDILDEFKGEYPLNFLPKESAQIDARIDKLSTHICNASSYIERRKLIHIRTSDINQEIVDNWQQNLNESFDESCMLRNCLKEIGILHQKQYFPATDGIRVYSGYFPKNFFVHEEAVHKGAPRRFRNILEDYRKYVLKRLNLEKHYVEDTKELFDRLEKQITRKNPSFLLLQTGNLRGEIRDDDRFERENRALDARHSFLDVPVLTESTNQYTALLLRKSRSDGVEFKNGNTVLEIETTPGEKTGVIDTPATSLESIPEQDAPHDFVRLDVRLRGYIQSKGIDGVLFQLESDDTGKGKDSD